MDGAFDPDPGDLEPPSTALAPTKEGDAPYDPERNHLEPPQGESTQVNRNGNEDVQDICIGSQEAVFMQPNFSYVALLKGYIDLNEGSHTINTQGQESCLYGTDNGETSDGGKPLLHLQPTNAGGNDANNTPSLEDLCMLGDFVDGQDNSPVQMEDLDAQTTTFELCKGAEDMSFDDCQEDPWRPTLFDDILLDQVSENIF